MTPAHGRARFLLGGALILAGCSGPEPSGPASEASDLTGVDRDDGSDGTSVLEGRVWARCWFSDGPTPETTDFACRRAAQGGYPYSIGFLYVSLRGIADPSFLGGTGSLGPFDEVVPSVRIRVARDAFPLMVQADTRVFPFSDPARADVHIDTTSPLVTRARILAPDATEERPLVLSQPFDLWPIRVVNVSSSGYELRAEPFPFTLAPLSTTMYPPVTAELTASIPSIVEHGETRTFYLPVPRDGAIRVTTAPRTADGGEPGSASASVLDGPGVYVFDGSGLRRVR